MFRKLFFIVENKKTVVNILKSITFFLAFFCFVAFIPKSVPLDLYNEAKNYSKKALSYFSSQNLEKSLFFCKKELFLLEKIQKNYPHWEMLVLVQIQKIRGEKFFKKILKSIKEKSLSQEMKEKQTIISSTLEVSDSKKKIYQNQKRVNTSLKVGHLKEKNNIVPEQEKREQSKDLFLQKFFLAFEKKKDPLKRIKSLKNIIQNFDESFFKRDDQDGGDGYKKEFLQSLTEMESIVLNNDKRSEKVESLEQKSKKLLEDSRQIEEKNKKLLEDSRQMEEKNKKLLEDSRQMEEKNKKLLEDSRQMEEKNKKLLEDFKQIKSLNNQEKKSKHFKESSGSQRAVLLLENQKLKKSCERLDHRVIKSNKIQIEQSFLLKNLKNENMELSKKVKMLNKKLQITKESHRGEKLDGTSIEKIKKDLLEERKKRDLTIKKYHFLEEKGKKDKNFFLEQITDLSNNIKTLKENLKKSHDSYETLKKDFENLTQDNHDNLLLIQQVKKEKTLEEALKIQSIKKCGQLEEDILNQKNLFGSTKKKSSLDKIFLTKKNKKLELQHKNLLKKIEKIRISLKVTQEENEQLRKKMILFQAKSGEEKMELVKKLSGLRSNYEKEKSLFYKKNNQFKISSVQNQELIKSFSHQISDLHNSLQKKSESNGTLRAKLSELKNKQQILINDLQKNSEKINQMKDSYQNLSEKNKLLSESLTKEKEQILLDGEKRLNNLEKVYENEKFRLLQTIQNLRKIVTNLENSFRAISQKSSLLDKNINFFRNNNKLLQRKVTFLKKENQKSVSFFKKSQLSLKETEKKLQDTRLCLEEKNVAFRSLKEKLNKIVLKRDIDQFYLEKQQDRSMIMTIKSLHQNIKTALKKNNKYDREKKNFVKKIKQLEAISVQSMNYYKKEKENFIKKIDDLEKKIIELKKKKD